MGQRTRDRLLRGSDFLFSFFVVHPLNVFYWRGTWDLYDLYVFPGDSPKQQLRSFSICLLVGSTIYLLSMTVLPLMEQYAQPKGRWRHLDVVTRRLFMYIFLFGVIGYWRGLWGLVDLCLGTGMRDAVIVYAIVPVTAWVVRGSRGTMSTPFGVQHDTCRDFYKGVPRFKSEAKDPIHYIFDFVFTLIFVEFPSILIWRSMFIFQDAWILPNNTFLSLVASATAGYMIGFLVVGIQFPYSQLVARAEKLGFVWKLLSSQGFFYVTSVSTVLIWRGTWILLKEHLIPGGVMVSLFCHVVGVVAFLFLLCFKTIHGFRCSVDAEEPGGDGVLLTSSMYYFGFLIRQQTKIENNTHAEPIKSVQTSSSIEAHSN